MSDIAGNVGSNGGRQEVTQLLRIYSLVGKDIVLSERIAQLCGWQL